MLTPDRPVRFFLGAQLVCIILIGAATSAFWGKIGFVSVMLGGGVAMMNVVGTAFAWPRLLAKKDVALALSIIVSKFALSIGIFYWLSNPIFFGPSFETWFSGDRTIALGLVPGTLVAFALGLSSVVPAAIVFAVKDFMAPTKTNSNEDLQA